MIKEKYVLLDYLYDLQLSCKDLDVLRFNLLECNTLLNNIFEMKELVVFDNIIIKNESIILIYRPFKENSINWNGYNCECGANFKIENNIGDNGVNYCPYCGVERYDMSDDAFDGKYSYIIEEF